MENDSESTVERRVIDGRVLAMVGIACAIAGASALVATLLVRAIAFVTNLAFFGRFSLERVSPADNHLGPWVLVVPVAGALIVGLMARYGSPAIRGHGIPEAMEHVLFNQSRIPARMTWLKPLSAVVAIGTGGPFGAEGPIIATGGALGSFVGQRLAVTAEERKTLLAAGAAAGMTATFGTPVAAVLLAIELLLFEYRPRSVIPVALACVTANAVRIAFVGTVPAFVVRDLVRPEAVAIACYVGLGAVVGLASVGITKAVYAVEDGFARLPVHWMWWPALGAIPVGIVGYFVPHTLGVGYDNVENLVSGTIIGRAALVLCVFKLVSWLVALGSGTSGGTLAPLFTIGGGLGSTCSIAIATLAPGLGVDPRVGALVGMAAMFAGASRALLASVVFAFEATRQPLGLLPLLGGCSAAYLVSCTLMDHSIMTEKIARRGRRVPTEYIVDFLDQIRVREVGLREVVTLDLSLGLAEARAFIASNMRGASHQGFPVVDAARRVVGVVTRRDLLDASFDDSARVGDLIGRAPIVVSKDATLRDAADRMTRAGIGRLPVMDGTTLVGIVTRSDLIDVHRDRLEREVVESPAAWDDFVRGAATPNEG